MKNENLIKIIIENKMFGHLSEPLTFASGISSPFYANMRTYSNNPEICNIFAEEMYKLVCEKNLDNVDYILGMETGGMIMGYKLAELLQQRNNKNIRYATLKKEAKKYGLPQIVVLPNGESIENKKCLLIEDMVTTGGSPLKHLDLLRDLYKAEVNNIISLITYNFDKAEANFHNKNINHYPLVLAEDCIDWLSTQNNKIKEI
ncbi:MAG: phosphoribosyltransferase family protein [Cyanobium sp. MAG06]|nr:phosphoribosyltransferase family protein [Cyanobium sp. MAG06]